MKRIASVRKIGFGKGYDGLLKEVIAHLEHSRKTSARSVNAVMSATYWLVGRRIVIEEQGGGNKASYGDVLLKRLSEDLARRFGGGFGWRSLYQMRSFYQTYPDILRTTSGGLASRKGILQTLSAKLDERGNFATIANCFPLPWSHYVRLLPLENAQARRFYEREALRGGWSVRQLDRQVNSQFYERTALSRHKVAMLVKGAEPATGERLSPEEEIKDPFILEFLGLKDEYSESDLEEALIHDLEGFLLELGGDFTFVGRQRRLRVGDEWYRVDLLFYHRGLRCLVVIDLKAGKFTHADAGQMHLYLNYAREHWTKPGENPPVGLILCTRKDEAVAHYSLEGLPNKILAAEYRIALPKESEWAKRIMEIQARLGRAAAARER